MKDCLFCKIIKKEIPCDKIYEDKDTLAFLDINPVHPGHTLVIPKQHFKNILDVSSETFQKVMETVRKISPAVKQGSNADGLSISISNEKEAGQVVFHLHVHIIPRLKNDGLKFWPQKKYQEKEASKTADKIKSFL